MSNSANRMPFLGFYRVLGLITIVPAYFAYRYLVENGWNFILAIACADGASIRVGKSRSLFSGSYEMAIKHDKHTEGNIWT